MTLMLYVSYNCNTGGASLKAKNKPLTYLGPGNSQSALKRGHAVGGKSLPRIYCWQLLSLFTT